MGGGSEKWPNFPVFWPTGRRGKRPWRRPRLWPFAFSRTVSNTARRSLRFTVYSRSPDELAFVESQPRSRCSPSYRMVGQAACRIIASLLELLLRVPGMNRQEAFDEYYKVAAFV